MLRRSLESTLRCSNASSTDCAEAICMISSSISTDVTRFFLCFTMWFIVSV